MYHYRESGLPNIYLTNGYHVVETDHGDAVSVDRLEELHAAIAQTLVEEKPPPLTGAEVRFIRKQLNLTQESLAKCLGVQAQSVRGWERRKEGIPSTADRSVRMAYRDITRAYSKTLDELARISSAKHSTSNSEFAFVSDDDGHWGHQPA